MENNVERSGDMGFEYPRDVGTQIMARYFPAGGDLDNGTKLGWHTSVPVNPVPNPLLAGATRGCQRNLRTHNLDCVFNCFHSGQNTTPVVDSQLELFEPAQQELYKPRMSLGKRLKQARKAARLTQRELAERAGVSQAVISALETRDSEWTQFLVELSCGVGVNEEWLAHGTGNKRRSDNQSPNTHAVPENNVSGAPTHYTLDPGLLESIFDELVAEYGSLPTNNYAFAEVVAYFYAEATREIQAEHHELIRSILEKSTTGQGSDNGEPSTREAAHE